MSEIIIVLKGLSQNACLFIALSFLYSLLSPYSEKVSRNVQSLIYGVTFSGIAGLGMLMQIELMPGMVVDGRIMLLGICGAYGGPLAGFVATLIVSGFRLLMGGSGVFIGLAGILGGGVIGVLFWYKNQNSKHLFTPAMLITMGLILTLHAQLWIPILVLHA